MIEVKIDTTDATPEQCRYMARLFRLAALRTSDEQLKAAHLEASRLWSAAFKSKLH